MGTYGVMMFPTDYAIQPVELAKAVEERGLDSLFFPEHTHIPTSRRSPWPGGAELPQEYSHTHDLFVALSAAAAVTKRIMLGTGICLVIERDPILLAKEVASLDLISNGRVILGIGGGWNAEEMENHGTNFKRRWGLLRERVLAMKEIWRNERAEFHGEFVNFDPVLVVAQAGPAGWSQNPARLRGQEGVRAGRRLLRRLDADQSRRGAAQGGPEAVARDRESRRPPLRGSAARNLRCPAQGRYGEALSGLGLLASDLRAAAGQGRQGLTDA